MTPESTPPTESAQPSKPLTDEQLDGVIRLLDAREKVEKLSDRELSALVLHHIWAKKVGWCSQEDFLLDEYITRFERMAGIKRDEDGNII